MRTPSRRDSVQPGTPKLLGNNLRKEDVSSLRVVDLREELKFRGFSINSKELKADLAAKLLTVLESEENQAMPPLSDMDTINVEIDSSMEMLGMRQRFSLCNPSDNDSTSEILSESDGNGISPSAFITPRTLELSEKIKSLEDSIAETEEGLKSYFFNYSWGRLDATVHDCYHKFYVDYGYRPNYSFADSFASLFRWHNETMNIWSHLIGFFCTFVAVFKFAVDLYQYDKEYYSIERLMMGGYITCASLCLLFSTLYHWFCCISPEISDSLLKIDLTGIALLIGSSYFPVSYFGFYCTPTLQKVYLGMSTCVLGSALISPWVETTINGIPARTILMASLAGVGVFPFVHWFLVTPYFYLEQIIPGFLMLGFWYTLGFTLYGLCLPEKLFPNRFWAVIVVPSHTLWHLCVNFAVYTWFVYMWKYEELLRVHQCKPYEVENYFVQSTV